MATVTQMFQKTNDDDYVDSKTYDDRKWRQVEFWGRLPASRHRSETAPAAEGEY